MEFLRLNAQTLPPLDHLRVAQNISTYLANDPVLRPEQIPIFEDIQDFFSGSDRRGYVESPTGSGKSLFIVEASKVILDAASDTQKPKILVVTPTKDLVGQIMGRSGEKGYGRFARELTVRSFFSDTPDMERKQFTQADVGVTTYDSLLISHRAADYLDARAVHPDDLAQYYQDLLQIHRNSGFGNAQWHAQNAMRNLEYIQGQATVLSKFNVFMFDEAHHIIFRPKVAEVVRNLPKTATILGFTATADVDRDKRLINILPRKIHSTKLLEGIESNMVAPLAAIGVSSGMRIEGRDIYDSKGEFKDVGLTYLARDPERNRRIVQTAKCLASLGMKGLISCFAGTDMWHARHIAELCKQEGIPAEAVHGRLSSKQRAGEGGVYDQFEHGDLAVLSFVRILGEGWDSNRAKYIINARPTRSMVIAQQRPGRVTRRGGLAVTIDIVDDYAKYDMPITVADILGKGRIPFGSVAGNLTAEDERLLEAIVDQLPYQVPVMPVLVNNYATHQQLLEKLTKAEGGRTVVQGTTFAAAHILNTRYVGLTEAMLIKAASLADLPLTSLIANNNGYARTLFNADEGSRILYQLPQVDPNKYYVDPQKKKWLAPSGLVSLFGKRYPGLTEDTLRAALAPIEDSLEWCVGRRTIKGAPSSSFRRFEALPLYVADSQTIARINEALRHNQEQRAATPEMELNEASGN